MHFKILKMAATSGFLTASECTKFVFGHGSAPDPDPRPSNWIKWALFLRGREGEKRGREGRGR